MGNIYENDGLSRSFFCHSLLRVVQRENNNHNGLFISINGAYGCGKTTCLDFIKKEFETDKENKNLVIYFDAWNNNFYDNSLISILNEISNALNKNDLVDLKAEFINASKSVGKLLLGAGKRFIKDKIGIDFDDLQEDNIFDDLNLYNKNIETIQNQLKAIISKGYQIIVLVDELDRCLPTKVINVLESLYKLLKIKGIATILAIDREQIEQTILTIFGDSTNTQGYLARFLDFEFEVPNNTQNSYLKTKANWIADSTLTILDIFKFELREKLKIINELVLNDNLDETNWFAVDLYVILLCLKRKNERLFKSLPRKFKRDQLEIPKLENTSYYVFNEYLKNKKIYEKIYDGKNFKIYVLSMFYELLEIDEKEIKAYLNNNNLDWQTIKNKMIHNREFLPTMLNNIDMLYT